MIGFEQVYSERYSRNGGAGWTRGFAVKPCRLRLAPVPGIPQLRGRIRDHARADHVLAQRHERQLLRVRLFRAPRQPLVPRPRATGRLPSASNWRCSARHNLSTAFARCSATWERYMSQRHALEPGSSGPCGSGTTPATRPSATCSTRPVSGSDTTVTYR